MRSVFIITVSFVFITIIFLCCKSSRSQQGAPVARMTKSVTGELSQIVQLAEAFKASLTPEQQSSLQLAYSKTDAVKWSNFPQGATRPARVGLSIGGLNPAQFTAFKALMTSVMSKTPANEGYDELEGILAADDYFGTTLGKSAMFGRANFFIAFLGTPSATGLWELQYGGHHFAFSNTYQAGKITGVTPSFRGVEPMAPIPATGRTYQSMEQERQAFSGLIEGLDQVEKSSAKLANTFSDVLLGPGKDGKFPATKQGLKVSELNALKQKLVIHAMELYVKDLDDETAKNILSKYISELPDTYISYSGSGEMNKNNDYLRIDGPSVWIEYSAQPSRDFPGTTHPHSVWRDRAGDYGGN